MTITDPTPPNIWRPVFLNVLSKTGNIAASARAVGVSPKVVYGLRKKNSDFAELLQDALDVAVEKLEEEAWRRATEGKSDFLLALLLKAHKPETYRDNYRRVEHTGPGGGPIPVKAYIGFDPSVWDNQDEDEPSEYTVIEGKAIPVDDTD